MHRAIIRHHLGPRCNDPLVYDGQYRCDVQRQPIGFFDGFADSGGMGIDKEATARSRWWCCLTASLAVTTGASNVGRPIYTRLQNVACHVHAREARERRVVSLTPEETRIIYYGGLPGRGKSYI